MGWIDSFWMGGGGDGGLGGGDVADYDDFSCMV